MMCKPCGEGKHDQCPSKLAEAPGKKPTGLSPEGDRIQRSGLCPCQHRVQLMDAYTTEAMDKVVIDVPDHKLPNAPKNLIREQDFHSEIHKVIDQLAAAGIVPHKCPQCKYSPAVSLP